MNKKIMIIGQFAPPIHGLSKALDTLYMSNLSEKYDLCKTNITNNKLFLINIIKLLISRCDLYYLTISQSPLGNIRDLIIIGFILMKKRKVIIHLHGGGFKSILENKFTYLQKKINYYLLKKVNAAIVLSESLKENFNSYIDEKKIFIVKNCVDDDFICTDEDYYRKITEMSKNKKVNILYLSNFIPKKGYKEVLDLATKVKNEDKKNFKFIFAGHFFEETEKKFFNNYIIDNNLEEIVDFKGIVTGEEKKELLINADFFILLTRYENEGQPISILEAMANGAIIITTDHAGIKDVVDNSNGVIVDKNKIDINGIYDRLFMTNEEKKSKMEISRKKIENEYRIKNYIESLDMIFESILNSCNNY